jgi:hypothetical protein
MAIFFATLAGWMNRKQQKVIEHLLEENRVPDSNLTKPVKSSD